MKKKIKLNSKNIIVLLILGIASIIIYGINHCFYSPSSINKYIASNWYKTPANSAFKDDNFYQCVVDAYNKKNNTSIAYTDSLNDEQLENITSLTCSGYNKSEEEKIRDVSGIEKLIQLTSLNLSENQLKNLNVDKNAKLSDLDVSYNQLTSLDISNNDKLTTLYTRDNQLTSLDISNNDKLTTLYTHDNQLTSLDISNNDKLTTVWIFNNNLTSIDVSNNIELIRLNARNNQLTGLDISKNTALTELDVHNNQLTGLDASKNTALTELDVHENQLRSLDVGDNDELKELYAQNNQLTGVDVSKNTALTELNVNYNQLTSLDVSKNTVLTKLYVNKNQLTSLDISSNMKLKYLDAGNNKLTSLNVNGAIELYNLSVYENQLTDLDVSKNSKLMELKAYGNPLSNLDLNGAVSLVNLILSHNNIRGTLLTELDVSSNILLETISVAHSNLVKLDISNNVNLKNLNVAENDLINLKLDNNLKLELLLAERNKLTSLDVSSNIELRSLRASYNQLTSLDVSKNTALTELNVSCNQLTSLDINKNTALIYLYAHKNQLTSLDISRNIDLKYLYVPNNQLTSLDVSKNIKLRNLTVDNNQLTSLNLSKNIELIDLYVHNNQLTSLDVSKNVKLKSLWISNNNLTSIDASSNNNLRYSSESECAYHSGYGYTSVICQKFDNNPYSNKIVIFKDNYIDVSNNKIVKLPNHFTPSVSYEMSDGLILNGDVIFANETGTQTYKLISKNPDYEETYTIEVVDIESNKYAIDKNKSYIDIGNDTDEEILDNITVLNGVAVIEEEELVVKNGDDEVKRFKLLSAKSSVYNLSNEYIYAGNDNDDVIISNIETNANINIENNILNISYGEDYKIRYKLVRHNLKENYLYVMESNSVLNRIEVVNGNKEIVGNYVVISYNGELLDKIPILSISSDIYSITDNYIYTKFRKLDIDKINKSEGLELVTRDEQLDVLYNDKLLDSKSILSLSMNSEILRVDNSKNAIYIKEGIEVSYNDFINSITYDDMRLSIEVYNLEKELVLDGNVTKGYELRIMDFNDNVIDTYNIELRSEFVDYTEEDKVHYTDEYGVDIFKSLSINNTFEEVRRLFETDGVVSIEDKSGKILEDSANIKTGDRFVINFPTSEYFIHLSVKGDVRGTGKIENEDVEESYTILRGEKEVEEWYKIAGDINNDGKLKINDVAKLYQYTKNKINSLE